jgi:hypothetical protein
MDRTEVIKELDLIGTRRGQLRLEIEYQSRVVDQEKEVLQKLQAEESYLQSKALNLRDGLAATLPG